MGAAWICRDRPDLFFSCIPKHLSSLLRAELFAIITLVICLPPDRNIRIFTDSLNFIHRYKSLMTPNLNIRQFIKCPNAYAWLLLRHLVTTKNLQLTILKVKAHSGDTWNDRADQLATTAAKSDPASLSLSLNFSCISHTTIYWNSTHMTLDTNIRPWIKKTSDIQRINHFCNLKSLSPLKFFITTGHIDWDFSSR